MFDNQWHLLAKRFYGINKYMNMKIFATEVQKMSQNLFTLREACLQAEGTSLRSWKRKYKFV
jgi:hypothetical protein